jgi:hypothetical protein
MVFDSDLLDAMLDGSSLSCHDAGHYTKVESKTINPPLRVTTCDQRRLRLAKYIKT